MNTSVGSKFALIKDINNSIAKKLLLELKNELVAEDKVVTGSMADSLEYFPSDKIVGSTKAGMDNIEYGRAAGSHVPIKPLMEWAKFRFNLSDKQAWLVAKDVENKIFEEGIPMTRFAKITLERFSNA